MRAFKKIAMLAAVATTIAGIGLAVASEQALEKREKLMKGFGANMKIVTQFVKEGTGTADDVAKAAAAIKADVAKIPDLFPAGTGVDDGVKTEARMEIWQDWDGFKAAATQLETTAGGLETAAKGGDKAAIEAAFGEVGKSCGGCHSKFRKKS